MLKAGIYEGTLTAHALTENRKGDLQIEAKFLVYDKEGGAHTLTWWGSLTEKGITITTKALIVLGLKGNNPAGPLEVGKKVRLTLAEDSYNGKTTTRIRWINHLSEIKNAVSPVANAARLAELEGAVALVRQGLSTPANDVDDFPF